MFGFKKKDKPKEKDFVEECSPNEQLSIIYPRIKTPDFLESLKQMDIPDNQMPFVEPFVSNLVITYAFDFPERFQMVTRQDMEKLNIAENQILDLALQNFSRDLENIDVENNPPLKVLRTGGEMEACALLLPDLWPQVEQDVDGELVAAVPFRDLVLLAGTNDSEAMKEIKLAAQEIYDPQETHAITPELFVWRSGIWQLYA